MTHSPGTHALLDLYDCDAALLADAAALQAQIRQDIADTRFFIQQEQQHG